MPQDPLANTLLERAAKVLGLRMPPTAEPVEQQQIPLKGDDQQGKHTWLDTAMDFAMPALGIEDQRPGLASALGTASGAVAAISPRMAKEIGKRMVEGIRHPEVKRVFSALQELYPRLMGHVDTVTATRIPSMINPVGAYGQQKARINLFADPGEVFEGGAHGMSAKDVARFNKHGQILIDPSKHETAADMANTAAHELTHSKQLLLDPMRHGRNYDAFQKSVGYQRNPFEVSARAMGAKAEQEFAQAEAAGLTPKQLRTLRGGVKNSPRMREFKPVFPPSVDLPQSELSKGLDLLIEGNPDATYEELVRQLINRRK
jgi:hypothetical protein